MVRIGRYGAARSGVVGYGAVWSGTVRCGRYGPERCGVVWRGAVWQVSKSIA